MGGPWEQNLGRELTRIDANEEKDETEQILAECQANQEPQEVESFKGLLMAEC